MNDNNIHVGKGLWDVVDNNMIIIGTLALVGMWTVRAMWADWCYAKTTENVALCKINSKSQQKLDNSNSVRNENEVQSTNV